MEPIRMDRRLSETGEAKGSVTLRRHEGASVFACSRELARPLPEVRQRLSALIPALQELVDSRGGLVGHIKAYLEEITRGVSLSAAGGGLTVEERPAEAVRLSFTAIVFGCDEEEILAFLEQELPE